jgi:nicotinamidase-related amidase
MSSIALPARHYCRYPFENPRGHVETIESLDPEQTVFVLVDVYGCGFDRGDPIPDFPPLFLQRLHPMQAEIVQERIRPALDAARAASLPVVYVENNWKPSRWQRSQFAEVCRRTESGHLGGFDELYIGTAYNDYSNVIAPAPGDMLVQKTMYDGFFETTLDTVLRNLGAKHLVCVGFCADICLLNTVIGAMYRNYRVVVLRDCTLAAEFADTVDGMDMTRMAIRYYEAMVGFTSTSEQFIAACAGRSASVSEPTAAAAHA